MSDSIRIAVTVERNGQMMDGFPLVFQSTEDILQDFEYKQGAAVNGHALPDNEVGHLHHLVVGVDKESVLHLNQDLGVIVNPGGFVVLANVNIFAGAGALNNNLDTPSLTLVKGFGAGAA
jgi:hypothetical protein